MNLFEEIKKDHETQRTLCNLLVKTNGESDGRKELYSKLKNELKVHADAEERYFYRPMFKYDRTQDQARHSVSEHEDIDDILDQLDNTDMSSPSWLSKAEKLKEAVFHHLDEEEQEVFGKVDKTLDDDRMEELAKDYREMMEDRK